MAYPNTVVFRGQAAVEGTAGSFDVILYSQKQSLDLDQQWDLEEVKDDHGFDIAWLSRNEREELDCMLKMIDNTNGGGTAAHAAAPAQTTANGVISSLGQPFLAPGSCLVLSGFTMTALNGTFMLLPGTKLTQRNTQVAEYSIKARKYSAAQSVVNQIPG